MLNTGWIAASNFCPHSQSFGRWESPAGWGPPGVTLPFLSVVYAAFLTPESGFRPQSTWFRRIGLPPTFSKSSAVPCRGFRWKLPPTWANSLWPRPTTPQCRQPQRWPLASKQLQGIFGSDFYYNKGGVNISKYIKKKNQREKNPWMQWPHRGRSLRFSFGLKSAGGPSTTGSEVPTKSGGRAQSSLFKMQLTNMSLNSKRFVIKTK